ncbi:uncharacterized protein LOC108253948 [Trichonephila clavata]|uniref:Uncharacterized protein LOC108253948 n=1 Tax=Trichonephila clavata TaxID=2740835 RepID=A0A8X6KP42_TRICU|nr:uncharacterized protein LOC108253948 [Trichonephila clavata]
MENNSEDSKFEFKKDEKAADSIARVSVKVPPFWKLDPRIWFMQIEAQFRNSEITADQSKYDIVISTNEAEIISYISDIVINLPTNDKYDTIKNRQMSVFADSETKRTQKLFNRSRTG